MAVDLRPLLTDLDEETAELTALVGGLTEADWLTPTPAAGWDIKDQVAHLAFFDDSATLAALDPARFEVEAAALTALADDFAAEVALRFRDRAGEDVLAWFVEARAALLGTMGTIDPGTRLPWFGPPMSVASSLTARLMETWAHGQDVADALGVDRKPTGRLRHVAHLGVATIGWSFAVRGLEPPAEPIGVLLTAPDGTSWRWGPDDAAQTIRGPALDFCLLVTQRRHRDDQNLEATGDAARRFLEIAQAFAGPSTAGRDPTGDRP
jgi:uncharacterized protein (TIGR03084 family)